MQWLLLILVMGSYLAICLIAGVAGSWLCNRFLCWQESRSVVRGFEVKPKAENECHH